MTKRELIDAYVQGRLGRRDFIRRLTAVGVSASAAFAYAQTFSTTNAADANRNQAGFVVRAQTGDEEYGTACDLDSDLQGAEAALTALQQASTVLDQGLQDFPDASDYPSLGDLPVTILSILQTMQGQLADQVDAVQTLVGDLNGTVGTPTAVTPFASAEDFLSALANALNSATSLFAGILPAIDDDEDRQTLTNIAVIVGVFGGFANLVTGNPLSETGFANPTCP